MDKKQKSALENDGLYAEPDKLKLGEVLKALRPSPSPSPTPPVPPQTTEPESAHTDEPEPMRMEEPEPTVGTETTTQSTEDPKATSASGDAQNDSWAVTSSDGIAPIAPATGETPPIATPSPEDVTVWFNVDWTGYYKAPEGGTKDCDIPKGRPFRLAEFPDRAATSLRVKAQNPWLPDDVLIEVPLYGLEVEDYEFEVMTTGSKELPEGIKPNTVYSLAKSPDADEEFYALKRDKEPIEIPREACCRPQQEEAQP